MPKTKLERWVFSGCFCEFSLIFIFYYSPVCFSFLSHTFRLGLLLCTYVLTTTTTLRPFNSLFSRQSWVSQKGKPFWILLVQEMTGWQWHQLDHMQIICTLLQTDNHASTSPLSFYSPDALPAPQPTASKQLVCNRCTI